MPPRKRIVKLATPSVVENEESVMCSVADQSVASTNIRTLRSRSVRSNGDQSASKQSTGDIREQHSVASHEDATGLPGHKDFLVRLVKDHTLRLSDADFGDWIVETAGTKRDLEKYAAFWDINHTPSRLDAADDLCERLEAFLLTFIADPAAWKKDRLETTAIRMTSVLKLFQPIIATYVQPPKHIFRRLDGLQRNMFRISPYASQSDSVKVLLELLVDACELYFMELRMDGWKLMANCVVYLLAKPKLTTAILKRLFSWSDFFLLFRAPIISKEAPDVSIRNLFPDLAPEPWEDEEERENSPPIVADRALMELEKTDYLPDAILQLFSRSDAPTTPDGKKLLTLLLTVNPDFMKIGRIALHDLMSSQQTSAPKLLEAFAEIILKAWGDLHKKGHPLCDDLEALIVTDLMQRSIRTEKNHPNKHLNKYCLMISHMYNSTESGVRRMFHSNYDLLVLDAVKSESVTLRVNALRMLGKCFPLIGPEIPKSQIPVLVAQQVDAIVLNMKHACPDFRTAAASAAGDAMNRAWALITVAERSELLKQLSCRLVCDDSSVPVRSAAIGAVSRILDQPLSRGNMVAVLTAMKVVATDEVMSVRADYYTCLLKAVQLTLHADGGEAILDSEQMLAHFVERDRPYGPTIEHILDLLVWNTDNVDVFLKSAVKLMMQQPAVAIKCFQTIPKTKSPEDIYKVLESVFGRVVQALTLYKSSNSDQVKLPLSMSDPARVDAAIELGGTIYAATVLVLAKNPELNSDIQNKITRMLTHASGYTDKLNAINLYRLACRLPLHPDISQYKDWCVQELRNVTTAKVEQGITLMTFVHAWGESKQLIAMAEEWLDGENKSKKRKADGDSEKQAQLGLLYLSMLISDPDISGTFNDMDDDLLRVAQKAADIFLKYLPDRLGREPRMDGPQDEFYGNLLVFLTMCYIHRTHYAKDVGVLRDHFQKILLKVKLTVFERLGLDRPSNVLYAIKTYKDNTKDYTKKPEKYLGEHQTVILARKIVQSLQEILHQMAELISMDDEQVQMELLGCTQAANKKIPHVTLVTPSETPRVSPSKSRGRPHKRN